MSVVSEFLPDRTKLIEVNRQRMSDSAFRRAFPTEARKTESEILRGVNADLRRAIERLLKEIEQHKRNNKLLAAALREAKDERRKPNAPMNCPAMAEVTAQFLKELESRDFRANNMPFTYDDMMSPRRSKDLCKPRHVAWWLCRHLCKDRSLPQITRFFNRMDHTSIMHGCTRAPDWMAADEVLYEAALSVKRRFEVLQ